MNTLLKALRYRWLKWTERKVSLPISALLPLERPGTGYGGWIIPQQFLHARSVVYLVGAGEDVSFDVAVADRYGCAVHIVDPTPRAQAHVELLINNLSQGRPTPLQNTPSGHYPDAHPATAQLLHFHPTGLWNKQEILRFYEPANPEHVSHSLVNLQKTEKFIEVPVMRLSQLMRENGHTHIDLLKIDIEGAEYTVLETLTEDQLDVKVLCIEFDESAAHHHDSKYMDRIEGALQRLYQYGYRILAKEPHCHNYTLAHTSILPRV